MAPALSALVLFTIAHMHATTSKRVFLYNVSSRNLNLCMWFGVVTLHIQFEFHRPNPYGSGVKRRRTVYYRTYKCDRFGDGFFQHRLN
jgi:hypothetical protein